MSKIRTITKYVTTDGKEHSKIEAAETWQRDLEISEGLSKKLGISKRPHGNKYVELPSWNAHIDEAVNFLSTRLRYSAKDIRTTLYEQPMNSVHRAVSERDYSPAANLFMSMLFVDPNHLIPRLYEQMYFRLNQSETVKG